MHQITPMNFRLILSLLILSTTFQGCISIKPKSQKSTRKSVETFFVGEEGTQYFIKPLSFKNQETNDNLMLDFSFRYKDNISEKDSTTVNLSIIGVEMYKKLDAFVIEKAEFKIRQEKMKLLFNERKKDLFVSRFTTKLSLLDLKEMFESNNWKVGIMSNQQNILFHPSKKTVKTIGGINYNVFMLME